MSKSKITWLVVLAGLFALLLSVMGVEEQGIMLPAITSEGKTIINFSSSHALVIGASAYRAGWPKLPGVEKDIQNVTEHLKKHGFNVEVVRDPDAKTLKDAYDNFIQEYGQQEDRRLLFYFAGHGHTEKMSYGENMGYIVPVDAPAPDQKGFLAKALNMQQMEVFAKQIQSRHALFLFDSCFSGSIFALGRATPESIAVKMAQPVRQFITSGREDEQVPDKSIFLEQFIAALNGEADLNKDSYVTGAELGEFLQDTVTNYSKGTQHPQYGKIRNPRLDKGDFVFHVTGKIKVDVEVKGQFDREALFWQSIQGSQDARDYEAYLQHFPKGMFASLAQNKLEKLKDKPIVATGIMLDNDKESKSLDAERQKLEDEKRVKADFDRKAREDEERNRLDAQRKEIETGIQQFKENWKTQMDADRKAKEDAEREALAQKIAPPIQTKTGSIVGEFVSVPGGTLQMGCGAWQSNCDNHEKPVQTVTVAGFEIGKYEITQGQWKTVMGSNPSHFSACGDNCPVEHVSWDDVQEFIQKLNTKGQGIYRLPTEAEWEYACRSGGKAEKYCGGDDPDQVAWYNNNSETNTHPVGKKSPNGLGIYDMSGNIEEWTCSDFAFYDTRENYAKCSKGDSSRIIRGGHWNSIPDGLRSSYRGALVLAKKYLIVGLRVLRTSP